MTTSTRLVRKSSLKILSVLSATVVAVSPLTSFSAYSARQTTQSQTTQRLSPSSGNQSGRTANVARVAVVWTQQPAADGRTTSVPQCYIDLEKHPETAPEFALQDDTNTSNPAGSTNESATSNRTDSHQSASSRQSQLAQLGNLGIPECSEPMNRELALQVAPLSSDGSYKTAALGLLPLGISCGFGLILGLSSGALLNDYEQLDEKLSSRTTKLSQKEREALEHDRYGAKVQAAASLAAGALVPLLAGGRAMMWVGASCAMAGSAVTYGIMRFTSRD